MPNRRPHVEAGALQGHEAGRVGDVGLRRDDSLDLADGGDGVLEGVDSDRAIEDDGDAALGLSWSSYPESPVPCGYGAGAG